MLKIKPHKGRGRCVEGNLDSWLKILSYDHQANFVDFCLGPTGLRTLSKKTLLWVFLKQVGTGNEPYVVGKAFIVHFVS